MTNCKGRTRGATGDVTGLTKLYVSDLRQHHTEQDLEVAFSRFGALREVVVMRHQDTVSSLSTRRPLCRLQAIDATWRRSMSSLVHTRRTRANREGSAS